MKTDNPNITARVIADSLNRSGNRLTSLIITVPRIVLAEWNTHRAISRNSASSRAIPLKKMIEMVKTNKFIPTKFQKHHSGMQGTEYLEGIQEKIARILWKLSSRFAILFAQILNKAGVTKQLCNRLLEPYMYHTIIATASEWENFIALRAHDMAEIHIQDAAYKVLDALNNSTPKMLEPGEWHIPFGDKFDEDKLVDVYERLYKPLSIPQNRITTLEDIKIKVATARCARVSYMNFEGKDDYEADIRLHDMLKESGHMSPFEHIARAFPVAHRSGNFIGFEQYRKTIEGENKQDERIIKFGYGRGNN